MPLVPLDVLAKELEESLVSTLILGLDAVVAEVRAGSHPAVDLVVEALDVLGHGQGVLKLLDVVGGLIARGEHHEGHLDGRGVGGVHHGRVDRGGGAEGVGGAVDGQGNGLAAPAVLYFEAG